MKKWYQSKTVLYNGAVLIAAIVSAMLAFVGELEAAGYVGTGAVSALVIADKMINIALRFVTTTGIARNG